MTATNGSSEAQGLQVSISDLKLLEEAALGRLEVIPVKAIFALAEKWLKELSSELHWARTTQEREKALERSRVLGMLLELANQSPHALKLTTAPVKPNFSQP